MSHLNLDFTLAKYGEARDILANVTVRAGTERPSDVSERAYAQVAESVTALTVTC